MVAGTDTGVPGVLFGVSGQMELLLLVEAGLLPQEAIRAATLAAARMLGRERGLGSIEPGKLADLVILDANPLTDLPNFLSQSREPTWTAEKSGSAACPGAASEHQSPSK